MEAVYIALDDRFSRAIQPGRQVGGRWSQGCKRLLMGRNARRRVNAGEGNTFDITLTAKLSGFSNEFKMFPFSTKYGGVDIQTAQTRLPNTDPSPHATFNAGPG